MYTQKGYDNQRFFLAKTEGDGEPVNLPYEYEEGKTVISGRAPHKHNSSGFVTVESGMGRTQEYYAFVVGLVWLKEIN